MTNDLGERMKLYERIECDRILIPHLPIYARLDGRCFSKFTQGMKRPYDETMTRGMIETTRYLIGETHAIIGYTQSDEISLLWYFPEPKSEPPFGGKLHKLNSILAALATAKFNHVMRSYIQDSFPVFDCRVFNLPNRDEAANVFLWRELDATKNAISMAASHYFSPKQLHGKSGKEKQEMLFREHSINFNDYPSFFKRGTFIRRETTEQILAPDELSNIPTAHRSTGPIKRTSVIELEIPRMLSITNRVGILFNAEQPVEDPDL